jgi:hypothetical protein
MSLDDENLKDAHLQKALRHAPDSDIAPSEFVRKTVLDYANKSVKTKLEARQESWFARVKNRFNSWQIPRWQLTGMGGLAASLLVVVMIWHENPDDPMQVGTAPDSTQNEATFNAAPKPEPTLAQNELARNQLEDDEASPQSAAAPEAASTEMTATGVPVSKQAPEKNQDTAEAKIAKRAAPIEQKAETAPQVVVIEQSAAIKQSADKPVVASAPTAVVANAEKDVSRRAKAPEQSDEVAMSAPVPAAPVAVDAAPASVTSAPMPIKKMADAEKSEAKQDSSSASGNIASDEKRHKATKRVGDDPLADVIVQTGGTVMAKQDIQAGKLRLLDVADYYKGKPSDCNEPFIAGFEDRVDAKTAYNIEMIYVCVATQQLIKEVELYNQTMRAWHMEKK